MFFVIETQTNDGVGSTIVTTFADRNEAESKFHDILKSAAISSVQKHGAVILSEDCLAIMSKCYEH